MNEHVTEKIFDLYAQKHDDFLKRYPDSFVLRALRSIIGKTLCLVPKCGRILDVGVGNGIWSIEIAKRGHVVTGIDISSRMLEIATKNIEAEGIASFVELVKMKAERITEFGPGSFVGVFAIGDLLNYCDDYLLILRNMYEVCRTEGVLVVSVISRTGLLKRMVLEGTPIRNIQKLIDGGKWVEHSIEKSEEHLELRTFEAEQLKREVEMVGFVDVSVIPMGIVPAIMNLPDDISNPVFKDIDNFLQIDKLLSERELFGDCAMEFCVTGRKR
jgi:ubiquinone/menaquinone biosynthesis C-methylase UbiE